MIYFLQPLAGGPVKIGATENLDRRRLQLERCYGQPLALLGTMDGGKAEEREIHERFKEHRIDRTEQFQPVMEIMVFIGRPLLVAADSPRIQATVRPIFLEATASYRAALKKLAVFEGHENIADLLEASIAEFALQFGITMPPRMPSVGGARPGAGRPRKTTTE